MPSERACESLAAHGIDLTELFREAIDRSGMSRYAIARELGVSESTLSRPYTGKRPPTLELLCDVARVAGLTVRVELKQKKR